MRGCLSCFRDSLFFFAFQPVAQRPAFSPEQFAQRPTKLTIAAPTASEITAKTVPISEAISQRPGCSSPVAALLG